MINTKCYMYLGRPLAIIKSCLPLFQIATQEEFLVIYSLAVNSDSEFDDYFKARRSFRENRYGATYR